MKSLIEEAENLVHLNMIMKADCPIKIENPKAHDWLVNFLVEFAEKQVKKCNIHDVSGCLYAFLYNSCIHESSWSTISLHYSKEGAEKAMQEHKQKALDEFNEMYADNNEFDFKFGEHEDWCVEPVEVLP